MSSMEVGPNQINEAQARALTRLLERGCLEGTKLPDVEPPKVVAIGCFGEAVGERGERTLGVGDESGRYWQITVEGITWPVGDPRGRAG